jgi:hypothetical protein
VDDPVLNGRYTYPPEATHTTMRRRALLGSLAAAVALSGCNDTSSDGTTSEPTPEERTLTPTETPTASATGTGGDADASTPTGGPTPTPAGVEFDASLAESTSQCGFTCRTVTYTVTNRGTAPAADVTVGIRVATGGDQVYEGTQSIGDIGARSRKSGITKNVDPGLGGGRKVQNNDGRVTVVLRPQAAGGAAATFEFERQLDV